MWKVQYHTLSNSTCIRSCKNMCICPHIWLIQKLSNNSLLFGELSVYDISNIGTSVFFFRGINVYIYIGHRNKRHLPWTTLRNFGGYELFVMRFDSLWAILITRGVALDLNLKMTLHDSISTYHSLYIYIYISIFVIKICESRHCRVSYWSLN